jgi:hypothetical protein
MDPAVGISSSKQDSTSAADWKVLRDIQQGIIGIVDNQKPRIYDI